MFERLDDVAGLRKFLVEEELTKLLAETLGNSQAESIATLEGRYDSRFRDVLARFINTVQCNSIGVIYRNAESEIELMFLNMLVMCFACQAPGRLYIQEPCPDAVVAMERICERLDDAKKCIDLWFDMSWQSGQTNYWTAFSELMKFIDKGIEDGGLDNQFKLDCLGVELLDLRNALTAVIQASLPAFKVGRRAIRADLLVFVPSRPDFRVAVECDGFQFHSSKQSFISDRKRDRLLKANGYDVLRYSGSEIYNDPIESAKDLARYLLTHKPPDEAREQTSQWATGTPDDQLGH